jgi:CDP-diacylglycerol--serine O-phosphatidyltransferase
MKNPRIRRLSILQRKPFDPASGKKSMNIYILPNLFTTGNMFFGFFSMIKSLDGDFLMAAYSIVAAAIFDLLDGRVARLTHATSKFGMEYDSLSDLVSFGVAPSILLYLWALKPFGRIGWLASFIYLACGALRLARFNVQVASIEKKYFQGLPSPIAAGIVATSVMAVQAAQIAPHKNIFILLMTILLGFVMVSSFRYRSFKELDFRQRKPFSVVVLGLCLFVFIALRPEVNLFIAFITYALIGAISGVLTPARKKMSQVFVANSSKFSKFDEIKSQARDRQNQPSIETQDDDHKKD